MRKHIQLIRPESLGSALVLALTVEAVDKASYNERPRNPTNDTASVVQGGKVSSKGHTHRERKSKRGSSQTSNTVAATVIANDSQIIQMLNKLGKKIEQQYKCSVEQEEEIQNLKKRLQRKP